MYKNTNSVDAHYGITFPCVHVCICLLKTSFVKGDGSLRVLLPVKISFIACLIVEING